MNQYFEYFKRVSNDDQNLANHAKRTLDAMKDISIEDEISSSKLFNTFFNLTPVFLSHYMELAAAFDSEIFGVDGSNIYKHRPKFDEFFRYEKVNVKMHKNAKLNMY